mmetsp:Transcript_5746/g.18065  ORF Transcript_5746/g.18065 Transcript_5746/m.18065 type:complete len:267 (+) Transcript_5746:491-1291(+)
MARKGSPPWKQVKRRGENSKKPKRGKQLLLKNENARRARHQSSITANGWSCLPDLSPCSLAAKLAGSTVNADVSIDDESSGRYGGCAERIVIALRSRPVNHEWSRTSPIPPSRLPIRSATLTRSSCEMKSRASRPTYGSFAAGQCTLPARMLDMSSIAKASSVMLELPFRDTNGVRPTSISNVSTPRAQKSTANACPVRRNISGAMYSSVPDAEYARSPPRSCRARPKSLRRAKPCASIITFSGLRSRYATATRCSRSSASAHVAA